MSSQRSICFLFLGDPAFDRRIQNFVRFFSAKHFATEIFYGAPEKTSLHIEGCRLHHIALAHTSGPRRFFEYQKKLSAALIKDSLSDILFACDLYSLRPASRITKDETTLLYDAREIYTMLPTVETRAISRLFWKRQERQGLAKADLVITTAPLDADAIREIHSFLPPHIVVKNMPLGESKNREVPLLRNIFLITENKKIIVYVGGLQIGRGLDASISVIKYIPEAALVIIGGGILKEHLADIAKKKNVSDRVYFYGAADSDDVIGLLRQADVGLSLIERISGSYSLALPSKIFEYLHAGLPIVSSPLRQVKTCFAGKEYIFYADEANPDEIVTAIHTALTLSQNTKMRTEIAAAAAKEFVFEHDAEKLYTMLIERK